MISVYIIINKINGAVYVGRTSNWKFRRRSHIYAMNSEINSKMANAGRLSYDLSFYGRESFIISKVKDFNFWLDGVNYEKHLTMRLDQKGIPLYNLYFTRDHIPNTIIKTLKRHGYSKHINPNKVKP